MMIVGVTGQTGSGKDTVADRLVKEHGYVKIALADPIKRFGRLVFGFTETQLWGPSEKRNEHDKRYDYYCDVRVGGRRFTPATSLNKAAADCNPGWKAAARALQDHAEPWINEVLPGADVQSLYDWFAALGNNHPRLSPRVMLQHLGTEWGREVADEDIWVNYMLRTAEKVLVGHPYHRTTGVDMNIIQPYGQTGVVVSDVRFHNELAAIKKASGKIVRIKRDKTDSQATKTGIQGHASEAEQKSFNDNQFHVIIQNNKSMNDLYEAVDTMAAAWEKSV